MRLIKFRTKKSVISVLVLVFGSIFLILFAGLLGFLLLQHRLSLKKAASEDAFHIAEAGINYYWNILNHTPSGENPEIQDRKDWCCKVEGVEYNQDDSECQSGNFVICGTCDGEPCYIHDYIDPETNQVKGQYKLKIRAKKICGEILGVYITSIGSTKNYPEWDRKVQAKFAATTIADYAYILNDSTWAGSDREIFGKYHSNGGIRMDGSHNSLVTSAKSDWLCTHSLGCYAGNCPSGCHPEGVNCRCNGVCGEGGPKDLWKYPVSPFDFAGISGDLAKIKNLAQTKGHFYSKASDVDSQGKGYHVIFKEDGSYEIRIVTDIDSVYACDRDGDGDCEGGNDWYWSEERIVDEYTLDTTFTPPGCGLIYIQDNIWVEGMVKGKKTIASANLVDSGIDTRAFLPKNIDYTTLDGSDSLGVIAEKDNLIPCHSPNDMTARGVFLAQKGNFGRRFYIDSDVFGWYCYFYPNRCCSDALRDHLLIYGSIVSNGRVGTRWGSVSGYQERENYFDRKLAQDPPPLLPYVSPEMKPILFEELE